MMMKNLFSHIPVVHEDELFENIIENKHFKIERIVSFGQATPEGQWYDQETDEWVILLKGAAGISFEGDPDIREMVPGDHILIPAHQKHRVAWTRKNEKTIWLAVHYQHEENNAL